MIDPPSVLSTISALAKSLLNGANQNEECRRLATHVIDLLKLFEGEVEAEMTADVLSNLRGLERTLTNLKSTLDELDDQPMLKKMLWRNDITSRIAIAYTDLSNVVRFFELGAKLDLPQIQAENEAARNADTDQLYERIQNLEQNDQAILEFLGINTQPQEVMMAIHKRLATLENTPERHLYEQSLRAIQCRSGSLGSTPDEFVITSLDIVIHHDRKLGQGGFAQVFQADWQGTTVAVKILNSSVPSPMFQKEINVWKKLRHLNILQFYGACAIADPPFAVCAFKSQGDAITYLQNNPSADYCKLVYEACSGLRYLHQNSVIHGDLKASNILVDEHGIACISDFGLSRIRTHMTVVQQLSVPTITQGTPRWMSPEQMAHGIINEMTDIYSFSMTIYEVFSGSPPFANTSDTLLFTVVAIQGFRPLRPTDSIVVQRGLDDSLWSLVEKCWSQDPSCRPSVEFVASQLPSSCPANPVVGVRTQNMDTETDPVAELGDPPSDSQLTSAQRSACPSLEQYTWRLLAWSEDLDVNRLIKSALQSYTALERWYTAERKGHTTVVKITDKILQQSEEYFDTISASMQIADCFVRQAAALGEGLFAVSASTEDFQRCLASMLHISAQTSRQSEDIEGRFGQVCAGFAQISDSVQLHLSKINVDSLESENSNLVRGSPEAEHRPAKRVLNIQVDLEQAQDDVYDLLLSTSHFRNWWAKITTELGTLESMADDIVHNGSNPLLNKNVSRRWGDVRAQYGVYMEQVVPVVSLRLIELNLVVLHIG